MQANLKQKYMKSKHVKKNYFAGRSFSSADRWGPLENDKPNLNFRNDAVLPKDMGGLSSNVGNIASSSPSTSVIGVGSRVGKSMSENENIVENIVRDKVSRGIMQNTIIPENRTAQSIRAKFPDANDCEIIVVAKPLT